ncbi:hypothetical protein ZIOFF_009286 [Zingiber officinale]|uniref:NEDD8-activating enzyme E1 regulatory subunit n=1 Tax=Zingiber officinale TaxID=94328 RepID=A0A8J5LW11_ZINOF|nr:hypothetical protein ZIOFF_009286 [Zingiber officinale]
MATAETKKTKYDRQLRIWGEQGQSALENANICLLNCGPTGSEALKNLVLGGIGSITVVDGSKVEIHDLGNNFLLDEDSLGQSKAKCVCSFLQELNDAVKAKFVEEVPDNLIEKSPSFFSEFTLVIATQLTETSIVKLDKICREANIMLVVARSYGLTGMVRISMKEHTVIESKPDHFLDDLRLHNPWPELVEFAKTIDLSMVDPVMHKHTPYIVVLINLAEKWAKGHGGCLPSSRQEKKDFKDLIKAHMLNIDEENYKEALEASFKVSVPRGISSELSQIINDSAIEVDSRSSDFWVLVAALKEFIENDGNGEPPLEGSIPDMTSSTESYVILQKIYQAKAESDCLVMERRVKSILKRIGRDPDAISRAYIKNFCKNARKLAICRYRNIEDEFSSPCIPELQKCLNDEDYSYAVGFYILLRAVDRFAANHNRFPGIFDGCVPKHKVTCDSYAGSSSSLVFCTFCHDSGLNEEISRLKPIAIGILSELGLNGPTLSEDLITEMCRFGASELHAVAAFIGGVASQEAIKLVTKQFVPLKGTFMFNGIDQKSQVLIL